MKRKVFDKTALMGLLLLLLATCGVILCASAQRATMTLTVKGYEMAAEVEEPIRIVQLTDLHGATFGEDNGHLIAKVLELEPDLVLMTGDMLDASDENAGPVLHLIQALSRELPVYYGYGNHEEGWEARTGCSLTPELERAGATVVNVGFVDTEVKGSALRIGGYPGYYGYPGMNASHRQDYDAHMAFFEEFQSAESVTILLCHIPTTWLDWGQWDSVPVDLVLSGHYHGGQVRIPGVGGVIAPYVGLFPPYTEGIFYGEEATCVLSTGLSSSPGIPRIFNLPQIVVVDLVPEN